MKFEPNDHQLTMLMLSDDADELMLSLSWATQAAQQAGLELNLNQGSHNNIKVILHGHSLGTEASNLFCSAPLGCGPWQQFYGMLYMSI